MTVAEVGFEGSGCCGGQVHLQGGTRGETPLPVVSVMDGAPRLPTEAGVSFGMVKGEVMKLKVLELIDGESQDPGNVTWSDGECIVVCWGEGHGIVVK